MRKLNPAMCLLCLLCLLAMPVGVRAETIFDSILGALRLKDVTTAAEAGAIPAPSSPETGDVLVWDGEAWVGGSVPAAAMPTAISAETVTLSGEITATTINANVNAADIQTSTLTASGTITATAFSGDGLALTGVASSVATLTDVILSTPTAGQVLVYDSVSGEWANTTLSAGGSVTSTAWDGSNWTATDVAPSQSAVQGALTSAHNPGMWKLVERKTVAGSAVSSLTFSGLNGDVDVRYYLNGYWVSAGGDGNLTMTCNTDTTATNYRYGVLGTTFYDGSIFVAQGRSGYSGLHVFDGALWAKTGQPRLYIGSYLRCNSATDLSSTNKYFGMWENTANNISQLVLTTTAANDIGVGTVIELWKLAQ